MLSCFSCKTQFVLRMLGIAVIFALGFGMFLLNAYLAGAAPLAQDLERELASSTPLENWQLVLSFLIPLAVAAITRRGWSDSVQALAAFGVAVVATVGTMFWNGQFTGDFDTVTKVLEVFALTIPFYYGLWKPLGATQAIHNRTGG